MDPRDVAMAPLKAAVERKRHETRRMKVFLRVGLVALRVKAREREMLTRRKKALLAKKAAMQKLVEDFMHSLKANEQNGAGNSQEFDEKAMKDAILTMMNGDELTMEVTAATIEALPPLTVKKPQLMFYDLN